MSEPYVSRRERLIQQLEEIQLGGLLVSKEVNVTYLTGFSGDSSYLIVTPQKTVMVSDGRYTTQIAQECPELEVNIRPPSQNIQMATAEVFQKLGISSCGFDGHHLTVSHFQMLKDNTPSVGWKDDSHRIEQLRMIKDETEIAETRDAIAIAQTAFDVFKSNLQADSTEKQLADAMEMYIRQAGGKCTSFPPIIASGERAALPHAVPTEARLGDDSFVLVDWGASNQAGYKSDLTRVLIRNTKATSSSTTSVPELPKVYELVKEAQARAIAMLRPGVVAGDVDAAARRVFEEGGYADYFVHSLGHGVGLEIHEGPGLRPNSDTILRPGMVVTIEPGLYIAGKLGVRIEDDVLITEDGCEVLTNVAKEWDDQFIDY
ncbi:MAG: M24 family metallopeptidase [Gemmataceae bacterium]